MIIDIVKVFIPAITAFVIGILSAPVLTNYLYSKKMWKRKAGKKTLDGKEAVEFNKLHKEKEVGTPRLGGVLIWFSVLATIALIWIISRVFPTDLTLKLEFFSRSQTWVPIFVMIAGALVGLIDDFLEIKTSNGGLASWKRLLFVGIVGTLAALWFFTKLGVASIGLPLGESFYIGWAFIPLFVLVIWLIYSGGVIDGIDGLAGGIFTIMFAAFSVIAFFQNQIDLAAFSATVSGAILAFLWFNIPPARFYMSETGSMALTTTLVVVAFMTDVLGGGYGVMILPIIAAPLILTVLSVVIQVLSKKLRGKKIFRVAPIHHHFEAIGWPSYKVTMRYWIIAVMFALIGVILALIG